MAREYDISKSDYLCCSCRKRLVQGMELVATVREVAEELRREDFCTDCWTARPHQDADALVGLWRVRVPPPMEKKKLLIDDELLLELFERLEQADTAVKRDLRFVLALILMRKKLLIYDRAEPGDSGQETWVLHRRGSEHPLKVVNPRLDEARITELNTQLGQILEGQL